MKKDLKFLRVNYLRGPNIWTYRPVIEAWVDIGAFEELPSNKLPGFTERLVAMLPGLGQHRCGVGEVGGFLLRLEEGTWLGHVLEHVTIELQNLAGSQVGFGKARQTSEGSGIYKVAVRTRDERVGRAAIAAGRQLILAAVDGRQFDLAGQVETLRQLVDRHCLGPSTACIVDAAVARGIPWTRLNEGNLVQLGYGVAQHRIWTAETDRTTAIAEGIAGDKDLTKTLLAACGVPVPDGRAVSSAADAWEAAEEIGVPVVVKPVDGNHGRGVSLELSTRDEVEAAFDVAEREGSEVIVERFIRGMEHRLLVVAGNVVAAGRGENIHVVGDGKTNVRGLIDSQLNSDPRRGAEEEFPLETIVLDKDTTMQLLLRRQGMDGESVPAEGQRVLIQRNGNVAIDCTDEVCPQLAATAALAARVVGLDVAGIDLVAEDVGRPLDAQGGAIVEVNAGPGLLMHLKPAAGKPRPVGEAIVDHLFPQGAPGRIPVVGVCGRTGASQVARLVAWIVHLAGHHVGLAGTDGLFLDRRRVSATSAVGFDAGESLLMNRRVETVVIESSAESILRDGLPYDRCAVGILTDVGTRAGLEEFLVTTDEQVFGVMRTQIDVVLAGGTGVINAAEPRALELARLCDGAVTFYDTDARRPALHEHRAAGGKAVFHRDGRIVLAEPARELPMRKLSALAMPGGKLRLDGVLAAVAATWALDVAPDLIAAGIETFEDSKAALAAGTALA